MEDGYKKFFKIYGLNNVFTVRKNAQTNKFYYDTSIDGFTNEFKEKYSGIIDEDTILFITANIYDKDENNDYLYVKIISRYKKNETDTQYETKQTIDYHLSPGDTMLWEKGDLFCISKASVIEKIRYNNNTRTFYVTYSNGTEQTITPDAASFSGVSPIYIDENNKISVKGFSFDERNNFIENNEKQVGNNTTVSNVHIEGIGNYASADCQHVQGQWSKEDDNSIFIIGNGQNNGLRKNIFTVNFDGTTNATNDIIATDTTNMKKCKLTDIHKVIDDDWERVGTLFSTNSFDDTTYDNSYN